MRKLCPICGGDVASPEHTPFCSKRCADRDLGRWFTGRYAVPATSEEDDLPDEEDAG